MDDVVHDPSTGLTRPEGDARSTRLADGTPPVEGELGVDLSPGDTVGAYRVVRPIARGGFGAVYEAEHVRLGRTVAIKVLHADGAASREVVARFEREARIVNLIRHASVVDIHDFGELPDGRPYFAMELLRGDDLRTVLRRDGAQTLATVLELLVPLCDALDAAHAKGVVHRDLKPSNVFVAEPPRGPVLLDFGVAKLVGDPSLTRSRQVVGTPTSMAPEQVRGEAVDARTDVYALGSLVYTLLTGRQPYAADTAVMVQYMHLFADPPRVSQLVAVDRAVDDVLVRALAKDPAQRPASAGGFLAELRAASAGGGPALDGSAQVVAVVLVHVAPAALADPDDATLAQLDRALCEGAAALSAAGFIAVIEGVDRIVLRRNLDALPAIRAAIDLAAARLTRELAGDATPWSLAVHVGTPGGADDPLDLAAWLVAPPGLGVTLTAPAAALLRRAG